jgi:hypothetical protein
MSTHTTNYVDTFISVAQDSSAREATEPPQRATPSVADATYRMIADHPYAYTSDDVIFTVWADRHDVPEGDRGSARTAFFSRGRACMRGSDLGKRYGWGVHADADSRIAIVAVGSAEYERLASGTDLDGRPVTVVRAMRSRR